MTARQTAIAEIANHRVAKTQDYLEHAGSDIYGQYVFGEAPSSSTWPSPSSPSCGARSPGWSRSIRRSSTRSRMA